MRTPKGKKPQNEKLEVNKLRKKAMKNKMMKKTLLTLAGDDTKDDIRDLMSDSNLSSISIIGRSPAPSKGRPPARKAPARSPARKGPKSPGRPMRSLGSTVSLRSLTSQLSMRSKKRGEDKDGGMEVDQGRAGSVQEGAKQVAGGESQQPQQAAQVNGHSEDAGSTRLQGVRNMLTNAVWGVPYAKVVEESEDLNGSQPSQSRCIIS